MTTLELAICDTCGNPVDVGASVGWQCRCDVGVTHLSRGKVSWASQLVTADRRVIDPKLRIVAICGPIGGSMGGTVIVDDPFETVVHGDRYRDLSAAAWAVGHPAPNPPHPGHMTRQRRRFLARKGER